MRCFLEISTGNGLYVTVADFGQYSGGMQTLFNLIGQPNLLADLNLQGAAQAAQTCQIAIDNLRLNINAIATAQQQQAYDQTIKYLTRVQEAGLIHSACTFRCVSVLTVVAPPVYVAN